MGAATLRKLQMGKRPDFSLPQAGQFQCPQLGSSSAEAHEGDRNASWKRRRGEELRNFGLPAVPVTSSGRFLSAVTTGPSFLRRSGLLLLSATFCFSLERSFRLGSEAAQENETVLGVSLQSFTLPAVELS